MNQSDLQEEFQGLDDYRWERREKVASLKSSDGKTLSGQGNRC